MSPQDILSQEEFDEMAKMFNGQIAASSPKKGEVDDDYQKLSPFSADAPKSRGQYNPFVIEQGSFAAPGKEKSSGVDPFFNPPQSVPPPYNPEQLFPVNEGMLQNVPMPEQMKITGASGTQNWVFSGPGGTPVKAGFSPSEINKFTPEQMASWPKTFGAAHSNMLGPRTADDFFGPNGNILSSLTDVDRINNPFSFDAAMSRLQANQLGRQSDIDRTALGRKQIETQSADSAARNATDLERQRLANEGQIAAQAIGHGRDARNARIEDTIIAQGLASGKSPQAIAAMLAQFRNLKVTGNPASPNMQFGSGTTPNPLLSVIGGAGAGGATQQIAMPPGPELSKIEQSEAVEKSLRELFGTVASDKGIVGPAKPIGPAEMQKLASIIPNDPDVIKHLVQQITGSNRIAGDPMAFGDNIARLAAQMATAVGKNQFAPGSNRNVMINDLMPFAQFENNANLLGEMKRGLTSMDPLLSGLNQLRLENGRVIPLGVEDIAGPLTRSSINPAEQRQKLAPIVSLLAEMIKSGAYK